MGVALARNQEQDIGPSSNELTGTVEEVDPVGPAVRIKLQDGRVAALAIGDIRRSGFHGSIKIGSTIKCSVGPAEAGGGLQVKKLLEYRPRRG